MAVVQKIISGNAQPNGGRAVTGIGGARGLDSSSLLDANHTLDPVPLSPAFIDQPIATINGNLDARYDDPRYYSGDAIT